MDAPRGGRRLTPDSFVTPESIRPAGGLMALLLTACATGVTVDQASATGPTLVLDVTNASSDDVSVGYRFDGEATSGAGEGVAGACERLVQPYGEVLGSYSIEIDGTSALEGTVPPNAAGAFLMIRVTIAADGIPTVAAPLLLRQAPDPEMRPVPGC